MIPDPIPFDSQDRPKNPPQCVLTPGQFKIYAERAKWDPKTIELLLKNPPRERFLCGGREVQVLT